MADRDPSITPNGNDEKHELSDPHVSETEPLDWRVLHTQLMGEAEKFDKQSNLCVRSIPKVRDEDLGKDDFIELQGFAQAEGLLLEKGLPLLGLFREYLTARKEGIESYPTPPSSSEQLFSFFLEVERLYVHHRRNALNVLYIPPLARRCFEAVADAYPERVEAAKARAQRQALKINPKRLESDVYRGAMENRLMELVGVQHKSFLLAREMGYQGVPEGLVRESIERIINLHEKLDEEKTSFYQILEELRNILKNHQADLRAQAKERKREALPEEPEIEVMDPEEFTRLLESISEETRGETPQYNITGKEIRAFGFDGLLGSLVRGYRVSKDVYVSFSRDEVNNFLGLLKFIRLNSKLEVESLKSEVEITGESEKDKLQAIEESKRLLGRRPSQEQLKMTEQLQQDLHLHATIAWAQKNWRDIELLVARTAPNEHQKLSQLLVSLRSS